LRIRAGNRRLRISNRIDIAARLRTKAATSSSCCVARTGRPAHRQARWFDGGEGTPSDLNCTHEAARRTTWAGRGDPTSYVDPIIERPSTDPPPSSSEPRVVDPTAFGALSVRQRTESRSTFLISDRRLSHSVSHDAVVAATARRAPAPPARPAPSDLSRPDT
jgi:hypothetical protein